jgi:hypothetical protein
MPSSCPGSPEPLEPGFTAPILARLLVHVPVQGTAKKKSSRKEHDGSEMSLLIVLRLQSAIVTRGLRVLREQLFLRLLLTTCRASKYTLDLESCLGTLRQS